jgi:hypothetical protein
MEEISNANTKYSNISQNNNFPQFHITTTPTSNTPNSHVVPSNQFYNGPPSVNFQTNGGGSSLLKKWINVNDKEKKT